LLRKVFASSNTYRTLHGLYAELGLFGTAATIVLPDFDNVIHHYSLTCGEYAIGTDERDAVDTVCREFQMTVAQCVDKFGRENCSTTIQNLWDRRAFDQWVDVVHLIEPRRSRDATKRDGKNKRFASLYIEP